MRFLVLREHRCLIKYPLDGDGLVLEWPKNFRLIHLLPLLCLEGGRIWGTGTRQLKWVPNVLIYIKINYLLVIVHLCIY